MTGGAKALEYEQKPMKLTVPISAIDTNPSLFLRDAGYNYIEDRRSGHSSYARPIGGGRYPRFHVYINEGPDSITFNLHLDQKQAIYEGVTAHSGEYDGPLVEGEVQRLRNLMRPGRPTSSSSRPATNSGPADPGDARSRRWSDMLRGA